MLPRRTESRAGGWVARAGRRVAASAKSTAFVQARRASTLCGGPRSGAASARCLSAGGAGTNGATRAAAARQGTSTLAGSRQERRSLPPRRVPSGRPRPRHAGNTGPSGRAPRPPHRSLPSSRRCGSVWSLPLQRRAIKPWLQLRQLRQPRRAGVPEQEQRGWPRANRQRRRSKKAKKSASETRVRLCQ